MTFFNAKMDILPAAQQELWPLLAKTIDLGFVLYGGTAIALRLGHRYSVDFDFFSSKTLNKKELKESLPFLANATTLQEEANAWVVLVPVASGQVKVSFFGTIDFGRIGQADTTSDGVLKVASLDDLLATKVKVILQRVESKDYIDIATIIDSGIPLAKGIAGARLLFGNEFQPSESLKALVYFQGGDLTTLDDQIKNILIDSVKQVKHLPQVKLAANSI